MIKIILIMICVFLLVGCNSQREQYCSDRNMTFDDTYVLQPNWTRCCEESKPTDDGRYKTKCWYYQFDKIENNVNLHLVGEPNLQIEPRYNWSVGVNTTSYGGLYFGGYKNSSSFIEIHSNNRTFADATIFDVYMDSDKCVKIDCIQHFEVCYSCRKGTK